MILKSTPLQQTSVWAVLRLIQARATCVSEQWICGNGANDQFRIDLGTSTIYSPLEITEPYLTMKFSHSDLPLFQPRPCQIMSDIRHTITWIIFIIFTMQRQGITTTFGWHCFSVIYTVLLEKYKFDMKIQSWLDDNYDTEV